MRSPKARAVRAQERVVLLLEAARREIALHDDRVGLDRLHLGDRAAVHHLGVRLLALVAAEHRPELEALHHPALGLAEVDVVHRAERREPRARARQRPELDAVQLVIRVG